MTRDIPQQEILLVDDFLQKFICIADGGLASKDQVDITLVLKSLPARVDLQNLYRVEMIGFGVIQKALIAFQNDDQDELFTHYDNRSMQRLKKLNTTVVETDTQSEFIKDLSHRLLNVVNMMLKRTGFTISSKKPDSSKGGKSDFDDEIEASMAAQSGEET